jgi:hypothetical protein
VLETGTWEASISWPTWSGTVADRGRAFRPSYGCAARTWEPKLLSNFCLDHNGDIMELV